MCAKSLQSRLTLCNPEDCSPWMSSSAHGILQARILEWIAIPFSRGSSQLREETPVSCLQNWEAGSLPLVPPGKPHLELSWSVNGHHRSWLSGPEDSILIQAATEQ